jgi:hypothetical protein
MEENVYMVLTLLEDGEKELNAMADVYRDSEHAVGSAKSYADAQKRLEGKCVKSFFEYGEGEISSIRGFTFPGRIIYANRTETSASSGTTYTWRAVIEKKLF